MSGPDGLDIDEFDDTCDHLMIWHGPRDDETLVATCRLLAPHRRSRDGRSALYTATEFDLTPVAELLPMTVEVGRTCVVPEERSGAAISLVWGGIARYVLLTGNRFLLGCASVSLTDGGANASAIATELAITTGSSRVLPCLPRHPFPVDDRARAGIKALAPPLLRGYLRLGAQVGSNPAWDQDFGAADFPVLLDYQQVPDRYLTHFLGVGG
jgi:putative hemolysin